MLYQNNPLYQSKGSRQYTRPQNYYIPINAFLLSMWDWYWDGIWRQHTIQIAVLFPAIIQTGPSLSGHTFYRTIYTSVYKLISWPNDASLIRKIPGLTVRLNTGTQSAARSRRISSITFNDVIRPIQVIEPQNIDKTLSNFSVSTVAADGLAPSGGRSSGVQWWLSMGPLYRRDRHSQG